MKGCAEYQILFVCRFYICIILYLMTFSCSRGTIEDLLEGLFDIAIVWRICWGFLYL